MNSQTSDGVTAKVDYAGGLRPHCIVTCEGTVKGGELVSLLHARDGQTAKSVLVKFADHEIGTVAKNIELPGTHDLFGELRGAKTGTSISMYVTFDDT